MEPYDLKKAELAESVGILVESGLGHIHLYQHKLFTLFSIAFQTMLYESIQNPGHYIIRIQDGNLCEKLIRKSKDESTRKFLAKLIIQRKLRYKDSIFLLDYFLPSSWGPINDISIGKIQNSLIVLDSNNRPVANDCELEAQLELLSLKEHWGAYPYYSTLRSVSKKTIVIYQDQNNKNFEETQKVYIPLIGHQEQQIASGVKISADIKISDLENLE